MKEFLIFNAIAFLFKELFVYLYPRGQGLLLTLIW